MTWIELYANIVNFKVERSLHPISSGESNSRNFIKGKGTLDVLRSTLSSQKEFRKRYLERKLERILGKKGSVYLCQLPIRSSSCVQDVVIHVTPENVVIPWAMQVQHIRPTISSNFEDEVSIPIPLISVISLK